MSLNGGRKRAAAATVLHSTMWKTFDFCRDSFLQEGMEKLIVIYISSFLANMPKYV